VTRATRLADLNVRDGAARYISQARDFVRRLAAVSSFEEASRAAVEAAQGLLRPTCATVASIENGFAPPHVFAAGPRAEFVGPALAQSMLDMNDTVRSGGVVLCEDAPHPHLEMRSELMTGLFENGRCRGVISCSWIEPRKHLPVEIATIETLVAMVTLVTGSFAYA
jgi:hypothetical protein